MMPRLLMPSKRFQSMSAARCARTADRAALALGDLAQALRVRRVGRADHDQRIDHRRHLLHRELAVGGGVADVFLVRPVDVREALLEDRDDMGGVVDRQRGLGDESEIVRVLRREGAGILIGLDQGHRARRQLAERADHLGMVGMADQEDFAAALEMDRGLAMHLGHQRAGRIQRKEIAALGLGRNRFRHAMGREHHRRVGIVGDFGQFLDENRALGLQAVHHIAVMDDLVPDIDRGAIDGERPFHGVDGPNHAGAEAPWRTKHDSQVRFWVCLAAIGSDLGTESPLADGQGTAVSATNWDCFRPLSRHYSRPLRANHCAPGPTGPI